MTKIIILRDQGAFRTVKLTLILSLCTFLLAIDLFGKEPASMGKIEFPNSGSRRAQADFIEGVLLLHSFSYDDAAEAFRRAQQQDPNFALAYWGEAMTYSHPVWGEQDTASGRNALNRLAPNRNQRLLKAPTQREKDYLAAVELLYESSKPKENLSHYADAMERLSETYPKDREAKAFYALSILGKSQGNRDETNYMKAAGLSLDILDTAPEHPGALHYLIHSVDDPVHAPIALFAANKYANVASAIGHAVHMPSHIYGPLGLWQEALEVNQKSWQIGEERVKNKHLGSDQRDYHDLIWLHHAYLQLGQYKNANKILNLISDEVQKSNLPLTRRYYTHMHGVHCWIMGFSGQQGCTQESLKNHAKIDDLEVSRAASELSVFALSAISKSNFAEAKKIISTITKRIADADQLANRGLASVTVSHCATHLYSVESLRSITDAKIMVLQLQAAIAIKQNMKQKAISILKKSVVLANSLPFEDGAAMPPKPAHEFLGDTFQQIGLYKEAMQEYQASLKSVQPHRSITLYALANAASKANDVDVCNSALSELQQTWKNADPEVKSTLSKLNCDLH